MIAIPQKTASKVSIYVLAMLTAACGGSNSGDNPPPPPPATYTVGGTVTGLAGSGLVLQDNGGDNLTVTASGAFTFKMALADGSAYSVAAFAQPTTPSQSCTATNGSGTLKGANVTNIAIACATNSFSVGGTITGMTGSGLVLQNNGADSLTVNAAGNFSFASLVASGSSYAVTVLTQPSNPAETCTVTGGTGTVTNAIVTTVAINCTKNPTTGSGFWIPYSATPVAGTSGGKSGVFVIPSGSLAASPTATFLSTTPSTILGIAWKFTLNGSGAVTAYSPAVMIYAAAGTGGVVHLYGVDLSNASSNPAPAQISNLALSAAGGLSALGQICDFQEAQTNLNDPTTLFVMLHIAGTTGCTGTNAGTDTEELVHYTDSAVTTPLTTQTGGFEAFEQKVAQFTPLYQANGLLSGVVMVDYSNDLDFLPSDNFNNQTLLATNVLTATPLGAPNSNNPNQFGGAATAFFVTTPTSGSGESVYMVNVAAGTGALVYSTAGILSHFVRDNTYLYFMDTVGGAAHVVRLSLATGASSVIYSFAAAANTLYDVIGSDSSLLVFDATTVASTTTTKLMSIPIVGGANPTSLGPVLTGTVTAFMIAAAPGDLANELVFVSLVDNPGGGATFSYSSEVLTPSGTIVQTLLANSTFLGRTTDLSGSVFQIRAIADTGGGYGGGSLSSVAISNSLTPTAFSTIGGGSYTWPAGFGGFLLGLANTIGAGDLTNGALQTGLAYDTSKFLIEPVSLSNTNVIF
jgi:hypothetical protein